MKATEVREKTVTELNKLDTELRGELIKLKFGHEFGKTKTSELKRVKKDIARVQTIITEKRAQQKA